MTQHDPALDPLRADCARCAALCCVAPAFAASSDFAIDKPAGRPCPNLRSDDRCGIHEHLRREGFAGCVVFDCFGAGQRVTEIVQYGIGAPAPVRTREALDAFGVVRTLHELLWHLREARTDGRAETEHDALDRSYEETDRLAALAVGEPGEIDVTSHRADVVTLLRRAAVTIRAHDGPLGAELAGADLVGAELRGRDLVASDLRGALLMGADLRGCVLDRADLTGADLRGAAIAGADLSGALFVTQSQLDAARGDASTQVPPGRRVPGWWSDDG